MSILIKGMEMPKDGEKLYMIVFSDGKACASYKPFEWHEVVSLPPHGRLGDLDAVEAEIREKTNEQFCVNIVQNAPTIIPASGGKEDE